KKIICKLPKSEIAQNVVLENTTPINYIEKKDLLDEAMKLDKIDPFDSLVLNSNNFIAKEYKRSDGKEQLIGIRFERDVHKNLDVNDPIYNHQKYAVSKFFRDFRGVGILADEVGMGKTIEAGMILSELAERKLISSVLIITSSEENRDNWVMELTNKFGLFELDDDGNPIYDDVRDERDILNLCDDGFITKPIVMVMDDFVRLNASRISHICFDLIIVDEAHNFDESDYGKKGMKNLRELMTIKKEKNKPYCCLLSGTPHKGNLDSMFPLWYFMKSDSFSSEEEAHAHYTNYLCHNTSTMAEYIEYYRQKHLFNNKKYREYKDRRINEIIPDKKDVIRRNNLYVNDVIIRNEFLDDYENEELLNQINEDARNNYYGLINSFMIRNHRSLVASDAKSGSLRKAYNYYYIPLYETTNTHPTITVGGNDFYNGKSYDITLNSDNFSAPDAIVFNNEHISIEDFLNKVLRNDKKNLRTIKGCKNNIIFSFLKTLNAFKEGNKGDSVNQYIINYKYYNQALSIVSDDIFDNIILTYAHTDEEIFELKAEEFVKIVSMPNNIKNQIIVFFDYEQTSFFDEMTMLIDYLKKKHTDVYNRLIIDKGQGVEAKNFEYKKDGILLASYALSQSANLQFCHTIINFSISKSPIIMDQKIGRIDRIGQYNDMQVYTLARLDKLEGYIATLFNSIKLFSGWKDDIILVTGCDNKNTDIKICDDCQSVYRDNTGSMVTCPSCGGELQKLEVHDNYRCSNDSCSYTFLRKTRFLDNNKINKASGFSYCCPNGEKLERYVINNKEIFSCPKSCLLSHCQRENKEDCKLAYNLDTYSTINQKIKVCLECNNKFCNSCSSMINIFGYDMKGNKVSSGCVSCASKPDCFFLFDKSRPVCPMCGSALETIVPATFDEFASYIWTDEHFIDDFIMETKKIKSIVNALKLEDRR
ncbi:MAG: SNF2-related protein, partial [Anaeroplasmataceae bacterium]